MKVYLDLTHETYITTLSLGFVVGMVSRRIVDKIM